MSAAVRILEWPREASEAAPLALWEADSAARAMAGKPSGAFQVSGVEIDSRDVQPGDLFFALKGENTDGRRFLDNAFARGAVAAVVDQPIAQPHILVSDTAAALEALGRAARERSSARIIGVTGSVGKTGVKEAIFAALDRSSRGRAHRSVRSYNNHVGVPLSLARMPESAEFGVFEIGMNHAGEIAALTRQVRPHVALITAIAPAHIEMLGSEAAIADAKSEVFEGLESGGTAIVPADSVHFERLRGHALRYSDRVVAFGRAAHAQVRVLDAVPARGGGSLVTADMGDRRICYTVSAPGDHWVLNSLAVMAAVHAAGGDLGAAGLALAEMDGLPGRGARSEVAAKGGAALLIDESYNANPASMRATLAQLGVTRASRRIVVLGAMKELGAHGPAFHAALARPIAEAGIDYALLVGDEMRALASALEADELGKSVRASLGKRFAFAHCADVSEAREALRGFGLERGDVILVKGSNSVGLGALVAELVKPGEATAPCST